MTLRNISRAFRALPPALRLFTAGSVALTVLALMTRFFCAHVLHLTQYPYGLYALPHDGDGLDLMNFYLRFKAFHSRAFFQPGPLSMYAYPAPVALLYWVFYRVRYAQIPFLLVTASIMAFLAWKFAQALRRRGLERNAAYFFVTITCLCSYPFYFEFTRANMEIFMWLFTAAGVYFILRDRSWVGAALLGIAISMKLYPFIMLGLLISKRQYRQAAFSLLVAATVTLAALWLICPDVHYAWQNINAGVAQFETKFVIAYWPVYIGVDHSLFGVLKRALGDISHDRYAHLLKLYTRTCALAGLLLYVFRIRKLPMLNQVLCLTVCTVMLPPVSFDYTLIHLYTPFALWALYVVEQARSGCSSGKGTRSLVICFILLLAQLSEIILHGERLNGQLKALTLLALFLLGLWGRFSADRIVGADNAAT